MRAGEDTEDSDTRRTVPCLLTSSCRELRVGSLQRRQKAPAPESLSPSAVTIWSPGARPAAAAGVPARTARTTGASARSVSTTTRRMLRLSSRIGSIRRDNRPGQPEASPTSKSQISGAEWNEERTDTARREEKVPATTRTDNERPEAVETGSGDDGEVFGTRAGAGA